MSFHSALLAALITIVTTGQAAAQERARVAVFDFVPRGGITKAEADAASSYFRAEVSRHKAFDVISREYLSQQVAEIKLQLSGMTSDSAEERRYRIRAGEILNVKTAITGTMGRLFGMLSITVQMADLETGRVLYSETRETTEKEIFETLRGLALALANQAHNRKTAVELRDVDWLLYGGLYKNARVALRQYEAVNGRNVDTREKLARINRAECDDLKRRSDRYIADNLLDLAEETVKEGLKIEPGHKGLKENLGIIAARRASEKDSAKKKEAEEKARIVQNQENARFWGDFWRSVSSLGLKKESARQAVLWEGAYIGTGIPYYVSMNVLGIGIYWYDGWWGLGFGTSLVKLGIVGSTTYSVFLPLEFYIILSQEYIDAAHYGDWLVKAEWAFLGTPAYLQAELIYRTRFNRIPVELAAGVTWFYYGTGDLYTYDASVYSAFYTAFHYGVEVRFYLGRGMF